METYGVSSEKDICIPPQPTAVVHILWQKEGKGKGKGKDKGGEQERKMKRTCGAPLLSSFLHFLRKTDYIKIMNLNSTI